MTRTGPASRAATPSSDLSAALLAAETSGEFPTTGWPALRSFLLLLAEAQASGNAQLIASQIDASAGPLLAVIAARQALIQSRQALDVGYATVAQAGDDPVALAESAAQLAALADDLAARAQQLGALLSH
jgi:hypothetical protein